VSCKELVGREGGGEGEGGGGGEGEGGGGREGCWTSIPSSNNNNTPAMVCQCYRLKKE